MSTIAYGLRRCVPGDEAALSLLGGSTMLQTYAGVLDGPDILAHCAKHHSTEAYAGYLVVPANRIYTAEVKPGDAAVGYIFCSEPDLPTQYLRPGDYELRRIYLLHRFQGLGIGRALMQQAMDASRELGRRRLLLGVYGKNSAAIRFYRDAGFTQIGERFFTVGSQTHHDAVMGRDIPAL